MEYLKIERTISELVRECGNTWKISMAYIVDTGN